MAKSVDFWFDYTCPFAYLASTQVRALAERSGVALAYLRARTDRAVALGLFGVPTFIAGDELFWAKTDWPSSKTRSSDRIVLSPFRITPGNADDVDWSAAC